jgi:hypothetical protein
LAGGVVLAAVVVYLVWPGPNLRAGSVALSPGPAPVATRVLDSYEVVYRHEGRAGGRLNLTTDVVDVRRPFDARVETRSGPPPGGTVIDVTINGFTRIKTTRTILAVPPTSPPADLRPDAFLRDAVRDGYAQERERRRVAGRTCRVIRTGPDSSGSIAPIKALEGTFVDRCFDAAGLLLEEASYTDGKLLDRRLAVSVDEHPDFDPAAFDVSGQTLDEKIGGGSVRQLTADSRTPGTFWVLHAVPNGFEHQGRYAVVPPQSELTDPRQRESIVATVDDVWTSGPDVLIVEQGGTLGGVAPFGPDANARTVDVGALGRGQLQYSPRSSVVRVTTSGGRFVVVKGTLAPTRLLAIARSLVSETGGALTVR